MGIKEWQAWISVVIPGANLLLILFGLIKVFNRHEDEWRDKERRLTTLENDVRVVKDLGLEIASMCVKLDEMASEISRVRDRLDRFLDNDVNSKKRGPIT